MSDNVELWCFGVDWQHIDTRTNRRRPLVYFTAIRAEMFRAENRRVARNILFALLREP